MSDFIKRLLSILLISVLCLHFIAILCYVSPIKISSVKLQNLSSYYVYPFFHQQWALFAPIPKKRMALYVRYTINNRWSDWENTLQKQINRHQTNVTKGNETKVLLFSNSLTYFFNSQQVEKQVYTQDIDDVNFQIIKYEVKNEISQNGKISGITNFEIIATCIEGTASKAYYFKNLKP